MWSQPLDPLHSMLLSALAAGRQIGVSPLLLAATNSSGAVAGKMISLQNVAVGVTTVGLIGQEGEVVRSTFLHSLLLALGLSVLPLLKPIG